MPFERKGPNGTHLVEVTGSDSSLVEVACNLFEQIFPEDRRYIPYIRACAQGNHPSHPHTFDHVWLVRRGDEWLGLRVFSYIKTRNFGHGAYIGFVDNARGLGLGRWLVAQTHEQLDEDARQFGKSGSIGYLIEVERPMDAESDHEREESEKRLRFHRRSGAIILPVTYTEPCMIESVDYLTHADLDGEVPRPMYLVFVPSVRGLKITNLNIVDLVYGIYLDVYKLPAEHEFVNRALSPLIGGVP